METKDIPNYPNYFITKEGKVFIKNYHNTGKTKESTQRLSSVGYLRVQLSCYGVLRQFSVHRLLANAFMPNLKNYPIVNHINCDKTDNRIENLEWCNYSQNGKHAIKHNRKKIVKGEGNGKHVLTENQVRRIKEIHFKNNVSQRKIAELIGVGISTINDIITRVTWKHI